MGQLADRTMKNASYSVFGFVWNLFLAFVSAPIIIHGLGVAEYGFFVLINTVLTVFSLLDLGVSYSFFKKLSERPDNPDYPELAKIFSLTFWFYFFIGLFSFILIFSLRYFFIDFFNVSGDLEFSYGLLFLLVGISFFIKMITIPIQQIPQAMQRSDLNTKIGLINVTLLQISSILVIFFHKGLIGLIAVQLFSALFLIILAVYLHIKLLPKLKILFYFSFLDFFKIFKVGSLVFVGNIMTNLFMQLDKFVLGFFYGPTSVSYYSSSQMIADKILNVSHSLSSIFAPVFSNVSYLEQKERLKNIFRRGIRIISIITFGLTIMVFSFGWEFLNYWLGGDFALQATPSIYILACTYFLLAIFVFIYFFLLGLKQLKFSLFSTGVIAILDIIFMFLLIPKYAVVGASVAFLLSVLPVAFFLYYVERKIFLSPSIKEIVWFYLKNLLRLFLIGIIVFFISNLFFTQFITNIWLVLFFGGIGYLIYIGLYKIFGFFENEDWDLFMGFLRKFFLKFKR